MSHSGSIVKVILIAVCVSTVTVDAPDGACESG